MQEADARGEEGTNLSKAASLETSTGSSGTSREPPTIPSLDAILGRLKDHLVVVSGQGTRKLTTDNIDVAADFNDSGYLDSFGIAEFLLRAEAEYGVNFPDSLMAGPGNTLEGLAKHILRELSAR